MSTLNKIAVLITCHNRKEKTLKCLRTLYSQTLPAGAEISVYLVDDGLIRTRPRLLLFILYYFELISGNETLLM